VLMVMSIVNQNFLRVPLLSLTTVVLLLAADYCGCDWKEFQLVVLSFTLFHIFCE
jgi:hypothetical protein